MSQTGCSIGCNLVPDLLPTEELTFDLDWLTIHEPTVAMASNRVWEVEEEGQPRERFQQPRPLCFVHRQRTHCCDSMRCARIVDQKLRWVSLSDCGLYFVIANAQPPLAMPQRHGHGGVYLIFLLARDVFRRCLATILWAASDVMLLVVQAPLI